MLAILTKLSVWRRDSGVDGLVGRTMAAREDHEPRLEWELSALRRHGAYNATIPRRLNPLLGICAGGRSHKLRRGTGGGAR